MGVDHRIIEWSSLNTPGLRKSKILLPRTAHDALSASSGKQPPKHIVLYLLCRMQSQHTTKDQQLFTAPHHTGGKQHPALKAQWECVMALAYTP